MTVVSKATNLDRLRAAVTVHHALNDFGVIGHVARHSGVDLDLAREGIDLVMTAVARVLREHREAR